MALHFGLVAGEISGDILGAGLIHELKKRFPDATFSGIGGERMIAEGMSSLYPMERLSVMGLVEPLKRLPELLRIRKNLKQHFLEQRPAVFIGIDSPDFTLNIEAFLKKQAIKTCHYVSPSVWAWRQGRINKIARSVDLMLTLLPFEAEFYQQKNVPVTYVGHPLADVFDLEPDVQAARQELGLEGQEQVLALLPGSRSAEVKLLLPVFCKTLLLCHRDLPGLPVVIAAANEQRREEIEQILAEYGLLDVKVITGNSRQIMTAASVVLLASGTATLEAMLLKKPMVVAYKMAPLSYFLISRMIKVPYVALPNLLANRELVPELLQSDAVPEKLRQALLPLLQAGHDYSMQQQVFYQQHQQLRCNANSRAAEAVAKLVEK